MNHESHENDSEDIHRRTIAAQKLVDDVVNHRSPYDLFVENLRAIGMSSTEGGDYVQQVNECMRLQGEGGGATQPLPARSNASSLPNLLIPRILQLTHHDHPLLKDSLPKNSSHSENVDNNFSIIRSLLVEVRMTYLKTLHGHFFELKSPTLVNHSELNPQRILWRTSLNFSTFHPPPLQLFQPQFYQRHLTSLLSHSKPFSTLTFKQHGSFANCSIPTKPSIRSSISCNFSLSLTRFLVLCGELLFKISLLTSRNCMLQWIVALVTTMMRRILQEGFRWFGRISIQLRRRLGMKQNGFGCFMLGRQALLYYIHIASMSSKPIKTWLLSYFAPLPMIHPSPSKLMLRPVTDMLAALIEWMTAVVFNSHFYHRCCVSVRLLILWVRRNALQSLAKIGVLGYAPIPALSGVNMGFVRNVEESTKLETTRCASLLSKLAVEKDLA